MIDLHRPYIPYFRDLNRSQIEKILPLCKVYDCKTGDIISLQGEFCQSWIILYRGTFRQKVKDPNNNISEKILLEGESFDFTSIFKSSITDSSLEAIEESSILVLDIVALRNLAKKRPDILALIKLNLTPSEAENWELGVMKGDYHKKRDFNRFRSSIIQHLLFCTMFLPIPLIIGLIWPEITLYGVLGWFLILLLSYLKGRLIYLDVNSDFITKSEFSLRNGSLKNDTIPIDKVDNISVEFRNILYKWCRIGSIKVKSSFEELSLSGVFKPEKVRSIIDQIKSSRINIDRAVEIMSFKQLYNRKKGLFTLPTALESDINSSFQFRKSIVYFLVRVLPPLLVFGVFSSLLLYLFKSYYMLLLNIPSIFITVWHFWDWSNDKYAFEGNRVIDIERRPFWGREVRLEVDINSVEGIKKEQKHFLQVLFNYGDIELLSMGNTVLYPSISKPDKVIKHLYLFKKYYQYKREVTQKMERQEEFFDNSMIYQELEGQ